MRITSNRYEWIICRASLRSLCCARPIKADLIAANYTAMRRKLLTQKQVVAEIHAMIQASTQRRVALDHDLTPAQLNQFVQGVASLSPAMAAKLGFIPYTYYMRRSGKR